MVAIVAKYQITTCALWIIPLLVTWNIISHGCAWGLQILDETNFQPAPKGTIKTIEVPEDEDIIDCIDIYKQPAFNDPRIKGLKMAPSNAYLKLFNKTIENSHPKLVQNWQKYGECPEGTIPIRRLRNNNGTIHRKTTNANYAHEYATGYQQGSIYHGAGATFNVWKPRVIGDIEFSLVQLWVVSGDYPSRNTIECGFTVYPNHYHRSKETRLFSYWTSDDYKDTGCYDMDCPGFVQTSTTWVLGGVISPVSTFGGDMVDKRITLARDWETKDWWLEVQGTKIGYFPGTIFTTLQDGANAKVEFGGEVINSKPWKKHTGTHMGSGRFPTEGFGKASFVRNIEIANEHYDVVEASLEPLITRPECYDLKFGPPETEYKTHFYFGGSGFSERCNVG